MTKPIEIVRLTRKHLLDVVKDLSIEQLNKIPAGFNNNIVWNLAHMVATQQNICYKRAGIQPVIEDRFVTPFLSGTKPEAFVSAEDIELIKGLFFSTLDELETDLQGDKFDSYQSWTTRYGNEITSGAEAVDFLPFHEGLHAGYIWALKRVI